MRIEIERAACAYVLGLPLKSRRIILRHLRTLEALDALTGASGIERLGGDIYRMHVSRTYTIIFRNCPGSGPYPGGRDSPNRSRT